MKIKKRTAPSPKGEITLFRINNASGASVELSKLGAGIIEVSVPDKDGVIENVALGYADPADYIADGPCMGKIPGRYANRIARGHLEVDGKTYQLAINNGPNALHGGPEGFQNQIWDAEEIENGVRFTYNAKDGEEAYPGNLKAVAEYTWSEDNVLTLHIEATADAPTVVNLTNHAYWNLDGADTGSVLDHTMQIKADKYLPTDDTLIPEGPIAPVAGTPMDFTTPRKLDHFKDEEFPAVKYGKGYDSCWAVEGWEPGKMVEKAVVLNGVKKGRRLEVSTDQPGVQIYTGCWLAGSPKNRAGRSYEDYDGVAIEAQGFPDAPNRKDFPTQTLNPGETYSRTIKFAFK